MSISLLLKKPSNPNSARDFISSQDELDAVNLPKEPSSRAKRNHPYKQLLGDVNEGLRLRNRVVNQVSYNCLQDDSWIAAMHDELHQFTRNDVWSLIP